MRMTVRIQTEYENRIITLHTIHITVDDATQIGELQYVAEEAAKPVIQRNGKIDGRGPWVRWSMNG